MKSALVSHPKTFGRAHGPVARVSHPKTFGRAHGPVARVSHPKTFGRAHGPVARVSHPKTFGRAHGPAAWPPHNPFSIDIVLGAGGPRPRIHWVAHGRNRRHLDPARRGARRGCFITPRL